MNEIDDARWNLVNKIDNWSNNHVQFTRLLEEIRANINFTDEQKSDLEISMDLDWENIEDIFERAMYEFEEIKEQL